MGEKALDARLYYYSPLNGYEPCGSDISGDLSGSLTEVNYTKAESFSELSVTKVIHSIAKGTLTPKRILKSGNRTIVFWGDGTKTIVKRAEDEEESDYAAFTAALGIKLFGSNSALKKLIESKTEVQKPKKQKEDD